MELTEFYQNQSEFKNRAEEKLGIKGSPYSIRIGGPEVIKDRVLDDFLVFNYLHATDLHPYELRQSPQPLVMMGEIGGIIPQHPRRRGRVLAIAEASVEKVFYGFECIKKGIKESNWDLVRQMEKRIEMPVLRRGKRYIVQGTRNINNYDFTTVSGERDPVGWLRTSQSLLCSSLQFTVLSGKSLGSEQYVFNIPVNPDLFGRMRSLGVESPLHEKALAISDLRESIVPPGFIAGFHYRYDQEWITLVPIIGESEGKRVAPSLKEMKVTQTPSEISFIGLNDTSGRYRVFTKRVLGIFLKPPGKE